MDDDRRTGMNESEPGAAGLPPGQGSQAGAPDGDPDRSMPSVPEPTPTQVDSRAGVQPPPPPEGVPPARDPGSGPPPPPPPPPAPGPPSGWGWVGPRSAARGPTLDVGSILGRTFDTYGREWSLFLALALPAGVGAFLIAAMTPQYLTGYGTPTPSVAVDPQVILNDAALLIAMSLVSWLLSSFAALSSIIAAHRLWSGQPTGLGDALVGAIRALPRAIGLTIVLVAALAAAAALMVLVGAALFVIAPALGVIAMLILGLVLLIGLFVVGVRLSLLLPVLALERTGVIETVSRTWQLTRGHAIMLFAAAFVVGLSAGLGVWGSSLISSSVQDRLVAGIATGLATVIATPLYATWSVIAWGDLVGGRHGDLPVMARGVGRRAGAALVVGFGVLLLVAGFAVFAGTVASQAALP